jgi:hypothetical protein
MKKPKKFGRMVAPVHNFDPKGKKAFDVGGPSSIDLYIFGGRMRSSEAALGGGGGAQRPVYVAMSSKRRVRAMHGRARAAKTH